MNKLTIVILFGLVVGVLAACGGTPEPPATPYPTYTPYPQSTPYPTYTPNPTHTPYPEPTIYPTYTPYPSPTPVPLARKGQWVTGHFWALKVVDIRTVAEMDGIRPTEDYFLVVEVDWKAQGTTEWHRIEGIDFELVDANDTRYDIFGMIYREGEDGPDQGPGETLQEFGYRSVRALGTANDTYKLVFDLSRDVKGLKLWYQDFPMIDLGLD